MKTKPVRAVSLAATIAAAAAFVTACQTSSGYKQADKTGAGIAQFRDEIANGKQAIDATMKALDQVALSANTDPRKPFEQFVKSIANLDATAAKVRKRAQDMQDQGAAYFRQWEQQLAEVKNEDIRKLAAERKAKLQDTFDSIKKITGPLKAHFEPWMSDLKDLQRYLSQDLTIAGVDAAKKMFAKTHEEGQVVQKDMEALIAELNTIAATLTPAKVPPSPNEAQKK